MSRFDGTQFMIEGDAGTFPGVERDSDGVRRYAARIHLASIADRNTLAGEVTLCTTVRVYGRRDANVHIDAGNGVGTLVYPNRAGVSTSASAILISLTAIRMDGRRGQRVSADAEWIVL